MDGPFISIGILKERIFEFKYLGRNWMKERREKELGEREERI